jgi:hypothetical protein
MFRLYDHLQVEIYVFQQLCTILFKLSATCFGRTTILKWKYIHVNFRRIYFRLIRTGDSSPTYEQCFHYESNTKRLHNGQK